MQQIVIVGAGHFGLSLSYLLRDIPHLVLESETIGFAWTRRWDSFHTNTPNWALALPGRKWEGDQEAFMTHHEVRRFLQEYARDFNLPVRENCKVRRVIRANGVFVLHVGEREMIECKQLVIATGDNNHCFFPPFIRNLSPELKILHSDAYRCPNQLPPGAVLILGGGQSGAQIADELSAAGRRVYWSLSGRPCGVREIGGKDYLAWWDIDGLLHKETKHLTTRQKQIVPMAQFPLIGANGRIISLKVLMSQGVVFMDRASDAQGDFIIFGKNVQKNVERAVLGTRRNFELLSEIARQHGGDSTSYFGPPEIKEDLKYSHSVSRIDLSADGIRTVICATGYRNDYSWIDIPDVSFEPISNSRGLYFLGLFNQPRLSSSCLCNGGRDASDLLAKIRSRYRKWK